jgi:hypothetical protein
MNSANGDRTFATGRPGKLTVAGRAGQFLEDSLLHLSSKQESLKRKAWKTPADKYANKDVDCKKWQFEALAGQYTLIFKMKRRMACQAYIH